MQQEQGSKQDSPNGDDQTLLARVIALEQEKRAELERAARQAERKEQETARKIERLEQARATDALKAEIEKQAMRAEMDKQAMRAEMDKQTMRAEQARTKDALKAEIEKQTMRAEMERRLQKNELEKRIEQLVLRAADQLRVQMESTLVQQMKKLQQQVSESSSPMLLPTPPYVPVGQMDEPRLRGRAAA